MWIHSMWSSWGWWAWDCLTTYTVGSLPTIFCAALAKTERLSSSFISGCPENEISGNSLHHAVCNNDDWKINYNAVLNAFAALGIRSERLQGPRNRYKPMYNEQFFNLIAHAYSQKEPVFIEIHEICRWPKSKRWNFLNLRQMPSSGQWSCCWRWIDRKRNCTQTANGQETAAFFWRKDKV